MSRLLARWDASPAEQAELSFREVVTLVNVRRLEVACLLGIFTRAVEFATGFRSVVLPFEVPLMVLFLAGSLFLRDRRPDARARWLVLVSVGGILFITQLTVAALAAQGRVTSGYPTMLLSLSLLFVASPRRIALPLLAFFISYSIIVLSIGAASPVKVVAVANAAVVSVIAIMAIALIHSARRRDFKQRREIREQNERLERRNAEMDSLMAITAHDLRSPLYGLRNLFDLAIRRAPQDPALPLTVLRQGMASLDSMLSLATRLLDAHAAESAPIDPLLEADIVPLLRNAASRIVPLARLRDVGIGLDLPAGELRARVIPPLLAQALDNLLSNAVRFSPDGGEVTIRAALEGNEIAIRVQDQGPGVDPVEEQLLFQRIIPSVLKSSETMPRKGLGLFIVATLAERMGATARHERSERDGATFVLRVQASDALDGEGSTGAG